MLPSHPSHGELPDVYRSVKRKEQSDPKMGGSGKLPTGQSPDDKRAHEQVASAEIPYQVRVEGTRVRDAGNAREPMLRLQEHPEAVGDGTKPEESVKNAGLARGSHVISRSGAEVSGK